MKMKQVQIMVIDDDVDLSMLIEDMLLDEGYGVIYCASMEEAYEKLEKETPQLILLDINLPDGTGFSLCRELRNRSKVPIIFASARTSEEDRINGLEIGGDDYLSKPYSLRELMSRIRSLLRRSYSFAESQQEVTIWQTKDTTITLDLQARMVEKNHSIVELAPKEFDLFAYLFAHRGTAVTKEQCINEVWGAFSQVEPATLTVHIRWLREKLEEDPSKPALIKTVWGVGYQMNVSKGQE